MSKIIITLTDESAIHEIDENLQQGNSIVVYSCRVVSGQPDGICASFCQDTMRSGHGSSLNTLLQDPNSTIISIPIDTKSEKYFFEVSKINQSQHEHNTIDVEIEYSLVTDVRC